MTRFEAVARCVLGLCFIELSSGAGCLWSRQYRLNDRRVFGYLLPELGFDDGPYEVGRVMQLDEKRQKTGQCSE